MLIESELVKIFFEVNGFYVKSHTQGSTGLPKKAGIYSILDIFNSRKPEHGNYSFQLFASDIPKIEKAQVLIRSHHSQKTNLKMLKSSAKLFALIKKDINTFANDKPFSPESSFNILVTPGFPTDTEQRNDLEKELKLYNVDYVLSYRTVFENILKEIDLNQKYAKDSPLEILRLLKIYDLIKGPQLELFQ